MTTYNMQNQQGDYVTRKLFLGTQPVQVNVSPTTGQIWPRSPGPQR
jgi:hypothetical protein